MPKQTLACAGPGNTLSLSPLLQNALLTVALMLLAILAGVMAGGSWAWLVLMAVAVAGLGHWAARHDWLVRAEGDATPGRRLRDAAVVVVSAVFAVAYVALTGGKDSPLSFAHYLPLVLAAICFGTRAGLATGLGMAALHLIGMGWSDPRYVPVTSDWEGAISFPLVAVCVSLLSKRNGERIRALSSEAHDLSTLLAMSQMMDTAVDLEMTLNLIMLNVQNLCDCQVCAIYLMDSAGESLELRSISGPKGRGLLLPSLPVRDAQAEGWRVRVGERADPLAAAFYAADASALRKHGQTRLGDLDPRARSFACLPLTSVERLIGMLYVGFDLPNGLRPTGVNCLEQFATRAGLALQRGLLQQDFQELAFTDAMTGLDNYRQFEQTLHGELHRAERYGRPLTVLLLDIDHFKTFNDTLGHPAGDALLGQLGVTLRNALRTVDRAARYGGEEFAVVCPETGPEEARLIAERIRRAVAETPFSLTGQGGGTAHVTVSVGFATFPRDAAVPADLVKQADAALYAAKRAGRDAVRGVEDTATLSLAA